MIPRSGVFRHGPSAVTFWGHFTVFLFYKMTKIIFHLMRSNFTHFLDKKILIYQWIVVRILKYLHFMSLLID